jgi:hypothetical protein
VLVDVDSIMGQPTPLTVLQDSATTGFKGVTVPLLKSRLKAEGYKKVEGKKMPTKEEDVVTALFQLVLQNASEDDLNLALTTRGLKGLGVAKSKGALAKSGISEAELDQVMPDEEADQLADLVGKSEKSRKVGERQERARNPNKFFLSRSKDPSTCGGDGPAPVPMDVDGPATAPDGVVDGPAPAPEPALGFENWQPAAGGQSTRAAKAVVAGGQSSSSSSSSSSANAAYDAASLPASRIPPPPGFTTQDEMSLY